MASTTNENVEFENVMFGLPISNNKESHCGNHLQHSDVSIELNNHSKNNGDQPATTSDQENSSITDVSEHVGARKFSITSNQTWFRPQKMIELLFYVCNYKHYSSLKTSLKLLASVVCFCLIVYLSTAIHMNQSPSSLKCQMCQDPIPYRTMFGSLFGNRCKHGSLGQLNYDCGKDSACFEMNVVHSQEWKENLRMMMSNHGHHHVDGEYYDYEYADFIPDHMKMDPYIFDGTFRGCIHGFGFSSMPESTCHFFNSSTIGHNRDGVDPMMSSNTWITTNVCTCTSDNCN